MRSIAFAVTLLVSQAFAGHHELVAPGAELKVLGKDYQFTEGPAVDSQGNVYFTDQPNDRILKWSAAEGKISVFMKPCGRSNGLYFDRSDNLWACADGGNELWKIAAGTTKATVVLKKTPQSKLFNGPNDLWIHPETGIVYFTDPFYKRGYWNRGPSESPKAIYSLDKSGKVRRLDTDFRQPNGIVGDGKKLYVADIGAKKTYVYEIQADGSLSNRRLFCPMGSDGMTLDEKGNLYLTGRGVTVFNPSGKKIHHIEVPQRWTANITFGGKDRKLLFITASKAVYGLKMNVRGMQP